MISPRPKKFIPLLFSTDMVKKLLTGEKIMTRRIVKGTALNFLESGFTPDYVADPGNSTIHKYGQPGDVIWVRETFRPATGFDQTENPFIYKADKSYWSVYTGHGPWKTAIHMPTKAARIFLEITDLSIERLQDISASDAYHEGVDSLILQDGCPVRFKDYLADASGYGNPDEDFPTVPTAKNSFQTLWMKINGLDSWDKNPWVWVIKFTMIDRPKDFLILTNKNQINQL